MLSIINNEIVVQKGSSTSLFTSLMAALLTVAAYTVDLSSLPFYLSYPQFPPFWEESSWRNTHQPPHRAFPWKPFAERSWWTQKALSEPSRVFKGSDKPQEIDGIIELFVLR